MRKLFASHSSVKAPVFTPQGLDRLDSSRWNGPEVTLGMARSNRLGANIAFLTGQKPFYYAKLPQEINVAELARPLKPFPVIPDLVTWLKCHVLFSRPVIALINHFRVASIDWYAGGFKSDMAIDMLAPSPGPNYDEATLYNCVVTKSEMRLTGLHAREERSVNSKAQRTLNWIAAKHVLLANYDPSVVYACELWTYRDEDGKPVLCINNNSGTYKPTPEQMEAFAVYLRDTFGVTVRTFSM